MESIKNSRKKFNCEICDYYTSNKYDYNTHLNTAKHKKNENLDTLEISSIQNPANPFYCNKCNYTTTTKSNYNKHLLTEKHNKTIVVDSKYICSQCKKEYLNYNALWKHKKYCIINEVEPEKNQNKFIPTNVITPELFMEILKESKELQNVLIEQNRELQNKLLEKESELQNKLLEKESELQNKLLEKESELYNKLIEQNAEHHKQIIELASKPTNINSHNTNNNQFNLQFFLNETCKDAMNIVDFVNSLKLTTDDFEITGRLGFIEGISRIFIKELKKLETEKLPIHCTDFKRETVYIKDNNIWEKENEEKKKLKWAIDAIAQLNLNQVQNWQIEYPGCKENNTKENEHFFKLAAVALGGRGKDEQDKYRDKIMRNVLKEVVLDKQSKVLK
jgi:hypothetical protein